MSEFVVIVVIAPIVIHECEPPCAARPLSRERDRLHPKRVAHHTKHFGILVG